MNEENVYSAEVLDAVKRQKKRLNKENGARDIIITQCIISIILCIIMLVLNIISHETCQLFLTAIKEKSMDAERLISDVVSYLGEVINNAN